MKVLIITASVNQKSGWGRYGLAVINELVRQGHDVQVLSEDISASSSIPIVQIKPLRSLIPLVALFKNMLVARLHAKDVDVVHALDGWPYGVYGLAAVFGTQKRLVVNGVGTYAVAPLYTWGSAWLLRRAYARAVAILCISNYTAKQIADAGIEKEKIHTVHMGAPQLPVLSKEEIEALVQTAGVSPKHHPVVLTVGAIKERKGQLDTLRAVEILKKQYPDILYLVVGSGNHKDYIKTLLAYAGEHGLSENLRIMSDVDDSTLAALYSSSTVFALNSNSDPGSHHFEGFGLVVLEAAGYGKPAVGSKGSGIEDAIHEGKTGFTTKQRDADDIARKVEALLARYEFFSANAKMWHSRFTWAETIRQYTEFYRNS